MTDIAKSFEKLKNEVFVEINGCLLERLSGDIFKWKDFKGTFPEVAEKIREAGMALQNSIRQPL
jgi:hypothetical protein